MLCVAFLVCLVNGFVVHLVVGILYVQSVASNTSNSLRSRGPLGARAGASRVLALAARSALKTEGGSSPPKTVAIDCRWRCWEGSIA